MHKIWVYGKAQKELDKQIKIATQMDERKEKLKKREALFIDIFEYSPFGAPIQAHQVTTLPSLFKELEGRLFENFEHEEEDGQINSLLKKG